GDLMLQLLLILMASLGLAYPHLSAKQPFFQPDNVSVSAVRKSVEDKEDRPVYASEEWWDSFWKTSDGWGKPNGRVTELLSSLDGTKRVVTVLDVGAGNGRNSLAALLESFETQDPRSFFVVHCIDSSEEALRGLRERSLPDWIQLVTQKSEVNTLTPETL